MSLMTEMLNYVNIIVGSVVGLMLAAISLACRLLGRALARILSGSNKTVSTSN